MTDRTSDKVPPSRDLDGLRLRTRCSSHSSFLLRATSLVSLTTAASAAGPSAPTKKRQSRHRCVCRRVRSASSALGNQSSGMNHAGRMRPTPAVSATSCSGSTPRASSFAPLAILLNRAFSHRSGSDTIRVEPDSRILLFPACLSGRRRWQLKGVLRAHTSGGVGFGACQINVVGKDEVFCCASPFRAFKGTNPSD